VKFDNTVNLALLVSLSTIFASVATTWFTKRYDLRLKKIELNKESLDVSYNNVVETFQNFVVNSGNILTRVDSSEKPTRKELQDFEASCLRCLLFLESQDREVFQEFRILVKIRCGHTDPRERTGDYRLFTEAAVSYASLAMKNLYGAKDEDKVFTAFNKCISIAASKLEQLERQKTESLTEPNIFQKVLSQIRLR